VEIPFLPAEVHQFLHKNIDFEQIAGYLRQEVVTNIVETATGLITGGLNFVLGIFSWFIVILYVVFIMLDYEKLIAGFKHMILPKYRKVVFTVANDVKNSMNRYFRGQALVAFIVGILFAIGFSIIGLPMAILLGLFIGLLNMVPYLQLISIIPTTVLCLVYSVDSNVGFWTIWWECMAVYVIVQVIQDFVLTPKIMGKAMGLNPAIILLSISVWGSLFGFIGLIIALPLTTLLISYYNRYISRRRPTPPSNPKDNSDKLPD
jgi:predicted PurR-regulated permease PerM